MTGMTKVRILALVAVLGMAVMACGDDNSPTVQPTTSTSAGLGTSTTKAAATGLKDACGSKVVVQTDWFPEPEHGAVYQLAGVNGTLDKEKGRYSGEIAGTGVQLEIRSGGPFTGFQQVSAQMYTDQEILLGFVSTDEAVQNSAKQAVVGVVTPLEKNPQILMWDDTKYDFKTAADIGKTDAKVLYFEGAVYIPYFLGKGWVKESQLDGSYDGSPARFVAEGNLVQQGFATNEPFKYENDVPEWGGKKIEYLLIHDTGLELYSQTLSVRKDAVTSKAACLKALVPMIQQAQVDYIKNPAAVNAKLLTIVRDLDTFWTLSEPGNADAVKQMTGLGIVANGPDKTLGNFDQARVQKVIDELVPIFDKQNVDIKAGIMPSDIVTNEFIDPAIGV